MIRRVASLILAAFLAANVAACATLPTLNSNQLGPEVQQDRNNETLYYSPTGPLENATQEQVISGFFYAGNGPQDDYAVAREFLTPNFASKWKPANETLIQSGNTRVVANTGTKVQIEIPFDARITSDGTYKSTPKSTQIIEVRLLQVAGQWRISAAPNLTILLRPNFNVLFEPVSIYFWDSTLSYLVPDLRWFPTRAALATRVTNALLKGPSPWLAPSVQTMIPEGTKLNINSVTVTQGSANVDLSVKALEIPESLRPFLKSQLLATLGGIDGISDVIISIQRTRQEIATGASGMPSSPSTLPIVLTKDSLIRFVGSSPLEISVANDLIAGVRARGFSLSSDESLLALLGDRGVTVYTLGLIGVKGKLIDSRSRLINPTIDPFGKIWSTTSAQGSELFVSGVGGEQVKLQSPLGRSVSVKAMALSPEGTRLAILHSESSGSFASVFSVIRDKEKQVIGFSGPLAIDGFNETSASISWADRVSLVGLSKDSEGDQAVITVGVGGVVTVGRPTIRGTQVVSAPGGTFHYLNESGDFFSAQNFTWTNTLKNVLNLRMAGQ
jgi:hypothetical protein